MVTHGTASDFVLTHAYVGFLMPLLIELQHITERPLATEDARPPVRRSGRIEAMPTGASRDGRPMGWPRRLTRIGGAGRGDLVVLRRPALRRPTCPGPDGRSWRSGRGRRAVWIRAARRADGRWTAAGSRHGGSSGGTARASAWVEVVPYATAEDAGVLAPGPDVLRRRPHTRRGRCWRSGSSPTGRCRAWPTRGSSTSRRRRPAGDVRARVRWPGPSDGSWSSPAWPGPPSTGTWADALRLAGRQAERVAVGAGATRG